MGKIFGDLSYAPTRTLYSGAPIEEVKALAQSADKSYKTNQDAFDALDVAAQNAAILAKDNPIKQARVQALKDQLKAASEGRMELAASQARKAAKDYATDQLFNAAQQDYQSNAAYIKDINDRKELSTLDKEAAIALTQYHNQNTLEKDPKTGLIKNRFSAYTAPEKSVDVPMEIRKFLDGAKDDGGIIRDKQGNVMFQDIGNGQYKGIGSYSSLSTAQATKMALEYGMQSPMIQSYMQFQNDAHNLRKFTEKDANGKLIPKNITNDDLKSLGFEVQTNTANPNGVVGYTTKDKKGVSTFNPLPIYDTNGNIDDAKAKSVYNQAWKQKELEKAANPAIKHADFYKESIDAKANRDYTDAKDKLPPTPAFTFAGQALHVNSPYKTPEDIQSNVKQITMNLQQLKSQQASIPAGSPGFNELSNKIAFQQSSLDRITAIHNKADLEAKSRLLPSERAALERAPNVSVKDKNGNEISSNELNSILEYKRSITAPSYGGDMLTGAISITGNRNALMDEKLNQISNTPEFKKYQDWYYAQESANKTYQKEYKRVLEEDAKNYTIQPTLGTIDETKAEVNSTQLSNIYNNNPGAFTTYINGYTVEEKDKPAKIKIGSTTLEPIPGLGYGMGATEIIVDPNTKKETEGRKMILFPNTPMGGYNFNIGKTLVKQGMESSNNEMYQAGKSMMGSDVISQLVDIRPGMTTSVVKLNKEGQAITIPNVTHAENGNYILNNDTAHPFPDVKLLDQYLDALVNKPK